MAGSGSRTILIIDDDASLVSLLAFFFEEKGFTVYTAHDGTEGVALARRHEPAVILSDMMMSRMHGFDLLLELRAEPAMRYTAIIIMSAKAYRSDIERARGLGATDYVVKPFKTDEMLALVERHLPQTGGGPGAGTGPAGP